MKEKKFDIEHFKVLKLPSLPKPNSVYYVLDKTLNVVRGYITDLSGIPIKFIDLSSSGVVNLTGTGVTGTSQNPRVDISTFVSSQIGNLISLSTNDGKLIVKPITSPDSSIIVTSTSTELQIELSQSILDTINSALQSGDNISELVNDVGYLTEADVEGTNLTYIPSPTNGIVNSNTGTDAIIPLANNINAGLISATEKANIITAIQPTDLSEVAFSGNYGDLNNIPSEFTPAPHTHNISDISGTKAGFDNALTDGDFLFVGDITQYTNEQAQDAVGNMLVDSATIDLTYNDSANTISADVKLNSIDATHLSDNINVSEFVNDSAVVGVTATNALNTLNSEKEDKFNKGVANGYAPLDSNSKISLDFINDALIGNVNWKGLYNGSIISSSTDPSLNGLPLPSPDNTNKGWYFISVSDYTYSGENYKIGDWIISNGITWNKVDNTDAVSSVFGRTGNITAQNGDYNTGLVTETTNKNYQTDLQKLYNDATSSIQTQLNNKQDSLVSGTSVKTIEGQSLLGSGNIDLTKSDVGLVNVDNTSDLAKPISTLTQTALNLKENISNKSNDFSTVNNTLYPSVQAVKTELDLKQNIIGYTPENISNKSDSYTASSTLTYPNTKALVDGLATKQPLTANLVTAGTGLTNYLAKYIGGSAIGNSLIYDNGSTVGLGTTSPLFRFDISGGDSDGIRYTGTSGVEALLGVSSSNVQIGSTSNHPIQFLVNQITRMTLTNAGLDLLGTPTAPTPTAGTNTTQIATTAFGFANFFALTGNQTFTGIKSATNTGNSVTNGLTLINSGTFGSRVINGISNSSGDFMRVDISSSSRAIFVNNSSSNSAISVANISPSGVAFSANAEPTATGNLYEGRNNSVLTYRVKKTGEVMASPATVDTELATLGQVNSKKNEAGQVKVNYTGLSTTNFTADTPKILDINAATPTIVSSPTTTYPKSTPNNYGGFFASSRGSSPTGRLIENPINGQVHTWRIQIGYSNKASGSNGALDVILSNPVSGFQYIMPFTLPSGRTSGTLNLNAITIADGASIPSPNGYILQAVTSFTDANLTLEILSITRISQAVEII